jgi:hypothetical protein
MTIDTRTLRQTADSQHQERTDSQGNNGNPGKTRVLLWSIQGVLGVLFLMTGIMKLATPADVLMAQMPLPLPILFVRFLGLAEFFGALGLVLPGLLRIQPGLTPLAASGLVLIMSGATVITLAVGGGAMALMPLAVGLLAAFVAYGRRR